MATSLDSLPRSLIDMGPIVGYTTQSTTRIWVRARRNGASIGIRYAPAAPGAKFDLARGCFSPVELVASPVEMTATSAADGYPVAQFEITGLEPNTRYFYEIFDPANERNRDSLATSSPFSFRTLPTDEELAKDPEGLRFAFFSCNGLHNAPSDAKPTAQWERALETVLANERIRFAILGGDQIYADHIRENWRVANSTDAQYSPGAMEEIYQHLRAQYGATYRAWWNQPAIRLFYAHIPCLMTWDDHEIYDGWGSHGNEHLPAQQAFLKAAAEAFDAHQMMHNPCWLSASKAHRAFAFEVGTTGFLVLDSRTARRVSGTDPYAITGTEQWNDIGAKLDAWTQEKKLSHLVVVTAVPPVFAAQWVTKLPAGSARDDLLDQWSSSPNRTDLNRLVGRLFQARKSLGANVIVLAGDVHAAAVGRIVTKSREHCRDGESSATVHQLVSSAIGHKPVSGLLGMLLERHVVGSHDIKPSLTGEIVELHRARNFALVSAVSENRAFWSELHLESQGPPLLHQYRGPAV